MKNIFALGLGLVIAAPALAGEVDIPNQFSAGTRAVAAQVNANFSAVENAIDDNARRIVEVENGILSTGVSVRVGGELVGRYLGVTASYKEVVVADSAGGGTDRVSVAANLLIAPGIRVVSPTGYLFNVSTSDSAGGRENEGELGIGILFYDAVDCGGNTWVPVDGDSGFFSTFTPNIGDGRPMKRWYARQGTVFQSPDPDDTNVAYMTRRGAAVETAPINSFKIWSDNAQRVFCINMTQLTEFDPTDPLDLNHSVAPVDPFDATEAGISGILGGELTIGL